MTLQPGFPYGFVNNDVVQVSQAHKTQDPLSFSAWPLSAVF